MLVEGRKDNIVVQVTARCRCFGVVILVSVVALLEVSLFPLTLKCRNIGWQQVNNHVGAACVHIERD